VEGQNKKRESFPLGATGSRLRFDLPVSLAAASAGPKPVVLKLNC